MMMLSEKATFGEKTSVSEKDRGKFTSSLKDPASPKYMGPERRRENRRQAKDRRDDVRFDLNNDDRRQSSGRREEDATPKFW